MGEHPEPAVDDAVEHDAADFVRVHSVRQEVADLVAELLAGVACRGDLAFGRLAIADAVAADLGVDRPGAEHRCVMRRLRDAELTLEGRHQCDHAALGDVVRPSRRTGDEARHRRRGVDVPATFGLLDQRLEDLGAVDRAPQVDTERPLPVVDGDVVELGEHGRTGVVAQDVDPSVGVHCGVGHRLHVVELRDVGLHADRIVAGLAQLGSSGLDAVGVEVGHHHRHAGVGERTSHAKTDAAGRTGDHRDLVMWFEYQLVVAHDSPTAWPHLPRAPHNRRCCADPPIRCDATSHED